MTPPRRRDFVLAGAFAILIAMLLWLPGCGPVSRLSEATADSSVGSSATFTISGNVSRSISPGELVALDLTLDNPNDLNLDINRITVSVVGIDAPQADVEHPCTAADFEVRHLSGGVVLRLAGNSTDTLSGLALPKKNWPAVGMINHPVNQDGCKGASLKLGYEANGMEVPR